MVKRERRYRAGVDIGGTTCSAAIVSDEGIICRRELRMSAYATAEALVEGACSALREMMDQIPYQEAGEVSLAGIGVGAPCANSATGEIEAATDLPWPSPIPLKSLFEKHSGLPTVIANDANAAAAGEMLYGNARGYDNFIVITLGTGVGAGVVCDGRLLNGKRGFAGELGHVTIERHSSRLCGCGRHGCLQNYCSAGGVVHTARELLAAQPDSPSLLRDSELSAQRIYEAALEGDEIALQTMRLTGEWLGYACAQFAAFSDPEAIILFGGVARSGDLLLNPAREAFRHFALHLYKNKVKFLTTGLPGSDAALLGAAALVDIN